MAAADPPPPAGRAPISGSLADMGVVDLVQLVEIGRKSGRIWLTQQGQHGEITFRDGRVVDAQVAHRRGQDAVYRLLRWREGDFRIDFGAVDATDAVAISSQGLLLEGMRRQDEWARLAARLPPAACPLRVDVAVLAARLAEVPDEANVLLRCLDGRRTAMEAVDACGLDDLEALALLAGLARIGVVVGAAAAGHGDRTAAAASIEAAFGLRPRPSVSQAHLDAPAPTRARRRSVRAAAWVALAGALVAAALLWASAARAQVPTPGERAGPAADAADADRDARAGSGPDVGAGAGAGVSGVLTRPPKLRTAVEAAYPPAARQAGRSGDVTMQVDLDASGHVTAASVSHSSGAEFDAAALQAIRRFVFEPAEIDGRPAAVQVSYTLHFALAPPPASAPVPAQPVALRGRVLARGSRAPVAGAAVTAVVAGVAVAPARTDDDGAFTLLAPPGRAEIAVRAATYAPFVTQETLLAGEELAAVYYLTPELVGGFVTEVRGLRGQKEVTRRTLQREELQSVPGSFGDALRVVQNLPGLARTPYSIGGLVVRGAAASDTGTYFDGVEIPLVFHFGAGPSVVNSEFLDRIDFYPGGFGARYGRAIGGILDVASRLARPDGIHGTAKIDLIDAGVYASVPVGKQLVVSAAARRSYIDAVLALALRGATAVSVAPAYYDYQARLDYRPLALPRHQFKLFFMGSNDALAVVSAAASGPAFQINSHQGFQRLLGAWSYRRDALALRTVAFIGLDQNSVGVGTSQVDSPALAWGVRQDSEFTPCKALVLRAGLDVQRRLQALQLHLTIPTNYAPFPGAPQSAPLRTVRESLDQDDFGEWAEIEARLPFGMRIIPSFRLDVHALRGATHLAYQPRLVVRQDLHLGAQPTLLKASIGWYSEMPPLQSLVPVFGNPSLPPQRARQLALGVEQHLTEALSIDITGFWSARSSLAVATTQVVRAADGTLQPLNAVATGSGDAYGLEVFLRQELSRNFFGWLAYTLSWSQQRSGAGQPLRYTAYDERHILTLIGQYRFASGWQAGGRFRLVTAAPSTPIVGATYVADEQAFVPRAGPPASARGPTFNQLDLRVDKVWLFATWQLGVYLDVQNVYNAHNQDFRQYDYRYQGSQSIPDVPILPTLGLKGVF